MEILTVMFKNWFLSKDTIWLLLSEQQTDNDKHQFRNKELYKSCYHYVGI